MKTLFLIPVLLFPLSLAQKIFRGGEFKTHEGFLYGRFETRMKATKAFGTIQSFFLYWDGSDWTESQWNDIDLEIVMSAATW